MKNDFFSKNLFFIRNKKKMTQAQIAAYIGVKRNSYNNYENGKSVPNLDLFKQIAKLFDISTEDLLYTDLSKGELIENQTQKKNKKKDELKDELMGELTEENNEKHGTGIPPDEMIKTLRNSLADKDKIISTQDALISNLNAQITALEHDLKTAQNIYTKLKKPAYAKPAQ